MDAVFSFENIGTLFMLTLLQAVLGFDNMLYISLESNRAEKDKQAFVRKAGIAIAVVLRIVLLFILLSVIEYFQEPLLSLHTDIVDFEFNLHSIIVLFGGLFIMYTAMKEIFHMIRIQQLGINMKKSASANKVIISIVLMNLVFSFDSILSAMALTKVFWVMATAIIIGGVLMVVLADKVAAFLEKNRLYEVLGLFILFIVGIMLISEGGHLAHLKLLTYEVTPLSKSTFYFVITMLVLVDLVQGRYQRKLIALKQIKKKEEAA